MLVLRAGFEPATYGLPFPLQSTALPTELSKEPRLMSDHLSFYSINPYVILLQIFSSFFWRHVLGLLKKRLQKSIFYVEQINPGSLCRVSTLKPSSHKTH